MVAEDDQDIPDTGAVFSFGKSKFADNEPSKFWIRNDRIQQIDCGDEHTAVVTESGRTFVFGSNDWGQLGHNYPKPALKPSCVKALKRERVTRVACGRTHTLVATESKRLYGFGANADGQLGVSDVKEHTTPTLISGFSADISFLGAGSEHSVALTSDGQLYMFGGGCDGVLGMGDISSVLSPLELNLGQPILSVACGYYHTALVTADGKVYTMGEREAGKLGLPEDDAEQEDFVKQPQAVERLPEAAVKVACGGKHTVVLTEEGKVFTFGDGSNGQLGLGTRTLESSSPQLVSALANVKVKDIACGESITAAISERGTLFVFGDGKHGKLALGNDNFSNQFWPIKVSRFENFKVEKVACGGCHMMVLAVLKSEDELTIVEDVDPMPSATGNSDKPSLFDNGSTARSRRHQKDVPLSPIRSLPPLKISGKYIDSSQEQLTGLDNEPGPSTEVAIAFLETQLKEVEAVKDLESIDLPEAGEESEASDIPELNETHIQSDINSNELIPLKAQTLQEESELEEEGDEEESVDNKRGNDNDVTTADINEIKSMGEGETQSQDYDDTRPKTGKQNVTPVGSSPNPEIDVVFKPQRGGVLITVTSVEEDDTTNADEGPETIPELTQDENLSTASKTAEVKDGKDSGLENGSDDDEEEDSDDDDDEDDKVVIGRTAVKEPLSAKSKKSAQAVKGSAKSKKSMRAKNDEVEEPVKEEPEEPSKAANDLSTSVISGNSTPKISPTAKKRKKGSFLQRVFGTSEKNSKEGSEVTNKPEETSKSKTIEENANTANNKPSEEITLATPLPSGKIPLSPTDLKNRNNLSSLMCLPKWKLQSKPIDGGDAISVASTSKPRSADTQRSSPKSSKACIMM